MESGLDQALLFANEIKYELGSMVPEEDKQNIYQSSVELFSTVIKTLQTTGLIEATDEQKINTDAVCKSMIEVLLDEKIRFDRSQEIDEEGRLLKQEIYCVDEEGNKIQDILNIRAVDSASSSSTDSNSNTSLAREDMIISASNEEEHIMDKRDDTEMQTNITKAPTEEQIPNPDRREEEEFTPHEKLFITLVSILVLVIVCIYVPGFKSVV